MEIIKPGINVVDLGIDITVSPVSVRPIVVSVDGGGVFETEVEVVRLPD